MRAMASEIAVLPCRGIWTLASDRHHLYRFLLSKFSFQPIFLSIFTSYSSWEHRYQSSPLDPICSCVHCQHSPYTSDSLEQKQQNAVPGIPKFASPPNSFESSGGANGMQQQPRSVRDAVQQHHIPRSPRQPICAKRLHWLDK